MRFPFIAVLSLSLALSAGCSPQPAPPSSGGGSAAAQEGADVHTFHLIMEGDTVASEVVRRTSTGVELELMSRIAGMRSELTMAVADDARVTGLTLRNFPLTSASAEPIFSLVLDIAGDTVRGEFTVPGRGTQSSALPTTPGAVAYLETSSAMVEQVLRRARAMGGDATVPVLDLTTTRTEPAVVRWADPRSAVVTYNELEVHATVGDDGSLLEYSVPALDARAVRIDGAHPLVSRP